MTSLGTDFETHATWQEYVEDPAAKDFVARKARTIALSKAGGTRQSTCEDSYTKYLCCDSAFAHKKEFYIFKFPKRFSEISSREISQF
jgi:hypothetical protein